MIKCIYKDSIKCIQYGRIHGTALIKSFEKDCIIPKGINVTLAALNHGRLEIIKENIGIVIEAEDNHVAIRFNNDIVFVDSIYAINSNSFKELNKLTIAYSI